MDKCDPKTLLELLEEIVKEYKWETYGKPSILNVIESEDKVYVIVENRRDRASIIGYGGIIVKEVCKRLGGRKVIVLSYTDLLSKRRRILEAVRSLENIAKSLPADTKIIVERILKLGAEELFYPPRSIPNLPPIDSRVAVAFSGGVDSTATLFIALKLGLNPIAVTVDPGPFIIPAHTKKSIGKILSKLKVEHHYIPPQGDFNEILRLAGLGYRVPCGACSKIIEQTVVEYARRNNIRVILFGDSLSTGRFSCRVFFDNIIRLNLPGFLSLSKADLTEIAMRAGHGELKHIYGCPLLQSSMKKHRWMKYIAIERILRETRAGILEPMDALRYIKNILKL